MVGTVFRDAILRETDFSGGMLRRAVFNGADLSGANLASSALERANFRAADLCGANLRSSNVRQGAFQNANLTRATFRSSAGCNTASFSAGTTFCGTEMCNGTVRNDDCPDGVDPADICCIDAQCLSDEVCIDGACVRPCRCNRGETRRDGVCRCGDGAGCPDGQACNELGECVDPSCCGGDATCGGYSNVDGLCCRSGRGAYCCCDSTPGAGDGFLSCIDILVGERPTCPSGVFVIAGSSASPNEDGVCARGGDAPPVVCPA
jgi:hypothetical protein